MKLNGIAGKGTGKAGEMVFSVFRGEQVVRWMPKSVLNPNTNRQQVSRKKFKMAVDLSRILNDALAVGYSGTKSQGLSTRNEFVKRIIPTSAGIITGTTLAELTIDITTVPMSRGNLPMPTLASAEASQAAKVTVPVTTIPAVPSQYGPGQYGLVVVVYCPDIERSITAQVLPEAGQAVTVDVPKDWSGLDAFVFAFGKVIPQAKNGVPSANEPWMYPSEASATQFVGTVNVI